MIKYFLLMTLVLSISSNILSKECYPKDSYTKYFFVNGVDVTKLEGEESAGSLKSKFDLPNVKSLYNPTTYDKRYALTDKKLNFKLELQSLMIDVFNEVFPQKDYEIYELYKDKWTKKYLAAKYPVIPKNPSKALVDEFLQSLDVKRSNIVFAHSQGNLVANQMCKLKASKKMEIISFATPAGELPCNSLKTYALFTDDVVIGLIKAELMPKGYPFIISTEYADGSNRSDLTNHFLETYLKNDHVYATMAVKLDETNNLVYNKDMNFNFLNLEVKANGKLSKIARSPYNILQKTFCTNNLVGEIQASTKTIIRKEGYKSPTECYKLGEKESLTDIEKMNIINFTKLGSTPIEIATSIVELNRVHPSLINHADLVSLKATLGFEEGSNNIMTDLSEIASLNYSDKINSKLSINCMEIKPTTNYLYLNLKPLAQGSKVLLIINDYNYDLVNYPKKGALKQKISEIHISLNKDGHYSYKSKLTTMSQASRDVASSNTTYNTNYCNTLKNLNNSLACIDFLKYMRDNIIPYLE